MGWVEALGTAAGWLGGDGFMPTLVRVAIGLELSKYLRGDKPPDPPFHNRQQVSPATDNKIPVVYGDAYLGGAITDVQLTNSNRQMWTILTICEDTGTLLSTGSDSEINIDAIYLNNNRVVFNPDGKTIAYTIDDTGVIDSNPANLMAISLYRGSDTPFLPVLPGTTTPITGTLPPAAYVTMPGWNASYTMGGIVFALVQMNYDPNKGMQSIPNLKFHVTNTLKKPGDVLYDYMTNDLYGAGLSTSMLATSQFTALNDYSDEIVCYSHTAKATAGAFTIGQVYQISELGTTDFTLIGAASNTVGLFFTASGVGSGTGTAYPSATTPATTLCIGTKYKIAVAGTTNWLTVGSTSNTVGTEFIATHLGSGTGTAYVDYSGTRYTVNGVVRTTSTVLDNMKKLAATAGSDIVYDISTGLWSLFVNQPVAQTLTFNDSNIIGQVNVTSSNMDQYYNEIEVQHPYSLLKDTTNIVRVLLPPGFQNPNELTKKMSVTHDYVNNVLQASILANLELRQNREDIMITFNTDFSMYGTQIGDVLGITNTVYGWTNKLFRVLRLKKIEQQNGQLMLEVTAQSYNPDVYTVEAITDFLPLTGPGYSIGSLSPITTPAVPTIDTSTISSQPSITLSAIVPDGVVTDMEFWYSSNTVLKDLADGQLIVGERYTILTLGTSDFTTCGASENTIGTTFIANQVGTTNNGTATYGTGTVETISAATELNATAMVAGDEYTIVTVGTTDYTLVGAASNTPGVDFVATGAGTGDGTVIPSIYTLLGVTRADNSGAFIPGQATTFKSLLLLSGTYTFKTRAGNKWGTSAFSAATAPYNYIYVNVPTMLPYSTPAGPDIPGMSMGLIAGYLASKLNWFGDGGILSGNATLMGVLGIDSNTANLITGSVTTDSNAATNANTALTTSTTANVAAQAASATATAAAAGVGAATAAANSATAAAAAATAAAAAATDAINNLPINQVVVPHTSTHWSANGIFPSMYGIGDFPGESDSRVAIYTHQDLVFAGSALHDNIRSYNIIPESKTLAIEAIGKIQNFYTFPNVDTAAYSKKPNYNAALTDKFAYGSTFTIYYSTATYAGGYLHEQTWSDWAVLAQDNGVVVTGELPGQPYSYWTNPPSDSPNYNPWIPNIEIIKYTDGVGSSQVKNLSLDVVGGITFTGGPNDLIMFGVSPFNQADGTPVVDNTIFYETVDPLVPTTIAPYFKHIVNNGSRFVGIDANSVNVYWSDDAILWTRISADGSVINNDAWLYVNQPFRFIGYDGTKFIIYNEGNLVGTSTDGETWTELEVTNSLDAGVTAICVTDGNYLAVGTAGIQTSLDGVEWDYPVQYAEFGDADLNTVIWDGAQFIVGAQCINGVGSAMLSSTDGVTWATYGSFNWPTLSQSISPTQNAAYMRATSSFSSSLP